MDRKQKNIILALGIVAAIALLLVLATYGYRRLSSMYQSQNQRQHQSQNQASSENSANPNISYSRPESSDGSESSQTGETSQVSESSEESESSRTNEASEASESSQASESSDRAETSQASESSRSDETSATTGLGWTSPDFTMLDMEGNEVRLSDFYGKPIVLNFWATWCGPCQMEMPELDAAYQQYGDEVVFLLVDLTDGYTDTVESATAHIQNAGYSFPIYFDVDQEGVYTYGITAIPTTFFFNSEGVLVNSQIGTLDHDQLYNYLDSIMD